MRTWSTIIQLIFLSNILTYSILNAAEVGIGEKIYSPNKENYIFISESPSGNGGEINYYNICISGNKYKVENINTPTFKIIWSSDSSRIITLNHTYKEIIVQSISIKNNKCFIDIVRPPLKTIKNTLVTTLGWIILNDYMIIKCIYASDAYSKNPSYYKAQYKYQYDSRKTYDFKSEKITFDEYCKLDDSNILLK